MSELIYKSAEMVLDEARQNIVNQVQNRIQAITYGELKPFTAGDYGHTTFYANNITYFELPQPLGNSWAYVKSFNDVEFVNAYDANVRGKIFKIVNKIYINPEVLFGSEVEPNIDVDLRGGIVNSWNSIIPNIMGNSITIANNAPIIEAMEQVKNNVIQPIADIASRNNEAINFLLGDIQNGVDGFLKHLMNELINDYNILNAKIDNANSTIVNDLQKRMDVIDQNIKITNDLVVQDMNILANAIRNNQNDLINYVQNQISTQTQEIIDIIDPKIMTGIEPIYTEIYQIEDNINNRIDSQNTEIENIETRLEKFLKIDELPTQPIFQSITSMIVQRILEGEENNKKDINNLQNSLDKTVFNITEIIQNPHYFLPRLATYMGINESETRVLFHSILIKLLR